MNRFAISTSVWALVEHQVSGDMGQPIEIKFKAKFKRLKTSEHKAFNDKLVKRELTDAGVLDQVLEDWDLQDAQGQPVTYTPDARAEAIEEIPGLEQALVLTFFEHVLKVSVEQQKEATVKN